MRTRGTDGRFGSGSKGIAAPNEGSEGSSPSQFPEAGIEGVDRAGSTSELYPLASGADQAAITELLANPRLGIERELTVIRRCVNPKLVLCEYWELASRRTCLVNVRVNKKFVKGMKFKMLEPVGELEFLRPWVYEGKGPRRKGRW